MTMRATSPIFLLLASFLLSATACAEERFYLHLSQEDVESTATSNGELWLKLSPHAASELRDITQENQGKSLSVYFEGIPLIGLRIHARVASGVIEVRSPNPSLLKALDIADRGQHRD